MSQVRKKEQDFQKFQNKFMINNNYTIIDYIELNLKQLKLNTIF